TTINRRSQQRVYAFLLRGAPGDFENPLELVLKGRSSRFGPAGGRGVKQTQRAFKLQSRTSRHMNNESRLTYVHGPLADFGRQVLCFARLEQANQRFKITAGSGAKLPVKVDWQLHLGRSLRSRCPRRLQ